MKFILPKQTSSTLQRYLQGKGWRQTMAICMDFQKKSPCPKHHDKRCLLLTCISFNIHELASSKSHFYVYDETVAKKWSDDVCWMLDNFIANCISNVVEILEIFCDSCTGQNKTYTVYRYLHACWEEIHRGESHAPHQRSLIYGVWQQFTHVNQKLHQTGGRSLKLVVNLLVHSMWFVVTRMVSSPGLII